ncbi:MAG: hypothetical protein A2Z86_08935 [Candidatus Glassbacteria bacterium GWA2_58_10]|uniref:Uncharacterized protein n=1 Tax=Candidatus Glassbacteria bacterium GWA2_58_10 TaxID=1817865 RepID=A0A1F5YEA6_9BACT|nr:MAG: hypothetical protein A2Z86_08935 [Candidatus Glassbacteria bacterium GWA2_58_10]
MLARREIEVLSFSIDRRAVAPKTRGGLTGEDKEASQNMAASAAESAGRDYRPALRRMSSTG